MQQTGQATAGMFSRQLSCLLDGGIVCHKLHGSCNYPLRRSTVTTAPLHVPKNLKNDCVTIVLLMSRLITAEHLLFVSRSENLSTSFSLTPDNGPDFRHRQAFCQ